MGRSSDVVSEEMTQDAFKEAARDSRFLQIAMLSWEAFDQLWFYRRRKEVCTHTCFPIDSTWLTEVKKAEGDGVSGEERRVEEEFPRELTSSYSLSSLRSSRNVSSRDVPRRYLGFGVVRGLPTPVHRDSDGKRTAVRSKLRRDERNRERGLAFRL